MAWFSLITYVINFNWTRQYSYGFECANSEVVNGFATWQDELWVAKEKGLVRSRFSSGDCEVFTKESIGLSGGYIRALSLGANEQLWVATNRGLDRINLLTNKNTVVLDESTINGVTFIYPIDMYRFVLSTNSGLYLFQLGNLQLDQITNENGMFTEALYYGIEQFNDDEWLVYGNNGLSTLSHQFKLKPFFDSNSIQSQIDLLTAVKVVDEGVDICQ